MAARLAESEPAQHMARIVPTQIKSGLTFDVIATHGDFPAPEWSALLILRGPGAITLESFPSGSDHRLQASAVVTSDWVAGDYAYSLRVTNGADVCELESGSLTLAADLAGTAAGTDTRLHARKVLAAIEAVIEGRASLDQERYRIGDRELYRTPIADLLKLRTHYRAELAKETARTQGYSGLLGREVQVRC